MHHLRFCLALLLALSACSDDKCPTGFVQRDGFCKRCPAGSESRHDECVSLDGGTTVEPVQTGPDAYTSSNDASSQDAGPSGTGGAVDSGNATPNVGVDASKESDHSIAAIDGSSSDASSSDASTSFPDASPPLVDPCRGIPQCTACTSDSECPEPGDCLVKHCNTSKAICEPTFAAAQTSCGTSKCDGNGKCVGCLNDSDCGAPGECKVRYCNPSTHVCEPKNAPTTTSCPTGHCDQGTCVQCSVASDCADKTCQTASCLSGQCRYANVPAGQKGTCSTGVCTATQLCRECANDNQCSRYDGDCTAGRCVNNACQSVAKTGPCGSLRMCSGGICKDSCNNGVVDTQAGEQCDPMAGSSTDWSCDSSSCTRTGLYSSSYRKKCTSNGDCEASEMCVTTAVIGVLGVTTPVCIPKCDGSVCRTVPGYSLHASSNLGGTACSESVPCFLFCEGSAASKCPPGVSCMGGTCAGPFY